LGSFFETEHIDTDLKVNRSEIRPWKAKSESPVSIGDEVEVEGEVEEPAPVEEGVPG